MGLDKVKFQKLTPVNSAEMHIYNEALDFVFANDDVKNVAISGAYSAGKSSVIETYKKNHSEKEFLNISLAHFEDENLQKKDELNNNIEENVLEGKILNQLIHQIDAKEIPQTNFRIKRNVSKLQSVAQAICIILFSIIVLYGLRFDEWKTHVESLSKLKPLLLWTTKPSTLVIAIGIDIIIFGYFLYCVIMLQKNKNLFKRLSVNGNEIEIFEQNNDSYFDKYLNEVLYLFDKSGANVIVFEDMDRYNSNQIFQRLREVNILVNNRRKKRNESPIRFFYLIRDDMFVSKERTKFFDFIIPIVPVIDGSNSYDQFIEHFRNGGILELFDEKFLQGISLYVDDMRILKNVYNEFVVYNARIGTTEQDVNKLLALIVYKNIFPRDFSDLQLNKGFVFTLFDSKDKFIEEKRLELQKKIEECNSKIEQMNKEILKSKGEIESLYTSKGYADYYGHTLSKYVDEKNARKDIIEMINNGEKKKIEGEIKKTENKMVKLENMKLAEIIDRDNIDDIFKIEHKNEIGNINDFNEIKGSKYFDLLKYLIRNGYIDETYPDYMTYFYENSLSRVDKVFLRSVTDQKAKEYTYALKEPQKVFNRLHVTDFENEEIMNFDLISYMLTQKYGISKHMKAFIDQLKDNEKYDFIIGFVESSRDAELFIATINRLWTSFFENMLEVSGYNTEQKRLVALLCLYASNNEELSVVNENSSLSHFISEQSEFLNISEAKTDIIINRLRSLNVKFTNLNIPMSNPDLWDQVYNNNLYELNWAMIENILEHQYKIKKDKEFKESNLTLILSKPQESLAKYVKENMNEYFGELLANSGTRISDTEDTVVFALNDTSMSDECKADYVDRLVTKVTALEKVDNVQWWTQLMDNEVVVYSEDNILQYFFGMEGKYDDTLIRFVNKYLNSFSIKNSEIDEMFGEKSSSIFFTATVKCNEMLDEKYEIIVSSMKLIYTSFSFEDISPNKVEILIRLHVIRMSARELVFMREHYPKNILSFIVQNCEEYVENSINEDNFILEEAISVLLTDVEPKYKIALLAYTDKPVSIKNRSYQDEVKKYILENNFDEADLEYLLRNYNIFSDNIKSVVENIAKNCIEEICSNEYSVQFMLLKKLLTDENIINDTKMEIFSVSVSELNGKQCKECLEILGNNDYLSVFDGKRPKFNITDVNKRILDIFQDKNWISKYEVEEEQFYRAIGLKSHTKKKK